MQRVLESLLGEGPAYQATSCVGLARPHWHLLLGEEQWQPSLPRRPLPCQGMPSVYRNAPLFKGNPVCDHRATIVSPGWVRPQNRRPLRSVPLRSPDPFLRNAAGPSQNSRPQVDSLDLV